MFEILVAVDGSDFSEKVVEFSCELAKKLSYGIALVYVSKNPDLVEEYIGVGSRAPSQRAAPYVQVAERLTSKFAEYVSEQGIPVEVILETGNPSDKIITIALFRKTSLIAIGLRGLHGIGRIRSLGSVSRQVLEEAPCPVIVVPETIRRE
jgi:nucleotide-binding universal stress UspA family protein